MIIAELITDEKGLIMKLSSYALFLLSLSFAIMTSKTEAKSIFYLTSGELTKGKSSTFAGGSACCGCQVEHYGQFPEDFPSGRVNSVTFYLRGSRENSYYTRIKNGPTRLKLVIGDAESVAVSEKYKTGKELSINAAWILDFSFSPPVAVKPRMNWKLLDADSNIYSAVLLHSGDIDLHHGIRGYYRTYGCQYSRIEDQSYSVRFDLFEPETVDKSIRDDLSLPGDRSVRDKIYKAAVVEFTERGELGIKDAGSIIAEWMITSLNNTGAFEVYERISLSKLMDEHKLELSGLMDASTIAEIGKIHGVEAIITGSVLKFGDITSVTAKVVDVKTAKIIDSADIKVKSVNAISSGIERLAWDLAKD